MTDRQIEFIKTISEFARHEYLTRDKWILPSVCIAQAALESGWNLEASTLFGIKGAGNTQMTKEFYNGQWVTIQDSFRSYPSIAASVVGYYDFLAENPRYINALNNPDYREAVYYLIHTTDGAPYATDPTYVEKVTSIIETNDLTIYDARNTETKLVKTPVTTGIELKEPKTLYIKKKAYVRVGPGTKFATNGIRYVGAKIVITKTNKKETWGYLRSKKGWISLKKTSENIPKNYTVKVLAQTLKVKEQPDGKSKTVTTVKINELYTIIDEKNGYGKLKSGAGWIKLKNTKKL